MLFHFPDTTVFMPHAFFTQVEYISNNANYGILLNCVTLTHFYGFPYIQSVIKCILGLLVDLTIECSLAKQAEQTGSCISIIKLL